MMASYLLSRTLVPTMVKYLLRSEVERYQRSGRRGGGGRRRHLLARPPRLSTAASSACATATGACWRRGSGASQAGGALFLPDRGWPARRSIPSSARISFRRWTPARSACTCAPPPARASRRPSRSSRGWRTPSASVIPAARADRHPRQHRPAVQRLQHRAAATRDIIGPFDGEILVSLKPGDHGPTWDYIRELRKRLNAQYPDLTVLLPAGRHRGPDSELRPARAHRRAGGRPAHERAQPITRSPSKSSAAWRAFPARWTCTCTRCVDVPELRVDVDRTRAEQLGLTQRDVANSLLISLSSSLQTAPNYWINPANQRRLPGRRADARVPRRFHRRAAAYARPRRRQPYCATAEQCGAARARQHRVGGQSLQRAAALRRVCQRAGPRPGQRGP